MPTQTYNPAHSNELYSKYSDEVRLNPTQLRPSGTTGAYYRTLLTFDLTDVTAAVDAASLVLSFVDDDAVAGVLVQAGRCTRAYERAQATWSHWDYSQGAAGQWTAPGGDRDGTVLSDWTAQAGAGQTVFDDADMVALVNDAITNRGGILRLLIDASSSLSLAGWYGTAVSVPAIDQPRLTLSGVGVPAAGGSSLTLTGVGR
jgi:uncharacterized protein YgiB involved in biofilm formation